jgi:hypothetical protein
VSVRIDRNYPLCFELYNVMVNRCRALNVQKLKPPDDYIKKLTPEGLRKEVSIYEALFKQFFFNKKAAL